MIDDIAAEAEALQELKALRESEALYRSLIHTSPDAIVLVDLDGKVLLANQRAADLFGVPTFQAMIGAAVLDLAAAEQGDLLATDRVVCVLQECCVRNREYTLRRRDGRHIPVEMSASLIREAGGKPRAYLAVIRDITDRKQAEERLREKEDQYRQVFEATSDGLIIGDLDGYVVEANPAAWAMHGYTREEFLGLPPQAYVHPEMHAQLPALTETIKTEGSVHFRGKNVRKDGTPFPIEVHGASFLYKGEPHILAVVRDVTEQEQAWELLQAHVEERTRELSTLLEVSRRVASTLEIEPLLGIILEQLKKVVDYGGASLTKRVGDDLVVVEYRGQEPQKQMVGLRWSLAEVAPIWELIEQGRPVVIPDIHADDPLARAFRSLGDRAHATSGAKGASQMPSPVQSWMGIPLAQKGQTMGVLSLVANERNFFTRQQGELALALASQAAVAMENAKFYKRAQEMAALEERARLARELHDSVTQALFSMTMHAEAAQLALELNPHAQADGKLTRNLRQLSELTEGALAEMRALIFELRPGALQEEGLVAALRKHTAALSAREGLPIAIQAPEQRVVLDPDVEEHLYRCAQEALHNVVKHAGASKVTVRLAVDQDHTLVLEVVDDGAGFDPAQIPAGHLGVGTMGDRVEQIGGTLDIQSAPGAGTAVTILVRCALEGTARDGSARHG